MNPKSRIILQTSLCSVSHQFSVLREVIDGCLSIIYLSIASQSESRHCAINCSVSGYRRVMCAEEHLNKTMQHLSCSQQHSTPHRAHSSPLVCPRVPSVTPITHTHTRHTRPPPSSSPATKHPSISQLRAQSLTSLTSLTWLHHASCRAQPRSTNKTCSR